MIPKELQTERLTLRPFTLNDAQAVFEYWNSDPNWSRFNESVPADYTALDAEQFVTDMIAREHEDRPNWAVLVDDEVVGIVSLTFEQDHRIAVIGYGVHSKLRGNGFSGEASQTVIDQAFNAYAQLRKIRAHTDARNLASIRVLEKLGFSREGILRPNQCVKGDCADEATYGLMRSELSK